MSVIKRNHKNKEVNSNNNTKKNYNHGSSTDLESFTKLEWTDKNQFESISKIEGRSSPFSPSIQWERGSFSPKSFSPKSFSPKSFSPKSFSPKSYDNYETSSVSSTSTRSSKSNLSRSSHGLKDRQKNRPKNESIANQIKKWASSSNSDEQLIEEYKLKAPIFDNPNEQRENFIHFTGYLAKYNKANLLEWYLNNKFVLLVNSIKQENFVNKVELFESTSTTDLCELSQSSVKEDANLNYSTKSSPGCKIIRDNLKSYSPMNYAIWPDSKIAYNQSTISNIKSIIKLFVFHGFGFISSKKRKDGSTYQESIIDALYDIDNPIPIEYKNDIFDYLMYELDMEIDDYDIRSNYWVETFKTITIIRNSA
jgi:hypothetical protein